MKHIQYGVVLGRFQPLHVGHLEYIIAAKTRCERLVVGVTNPNITDLKFHEADPKRSLSMNNPYSFFARYEMIDATLHGEGWSPESFAIIPADLNDGSRLLAFLPPPERSTVFITVYDAWGEEKVQRLSKLGFAVEILWRRDMSDRVTSGTEIRDRMRREESWRHLVPAPVAGYLEKLNTGLPRLDTVELGAAESVTYPCCEAENSDGM